MVIVHSYVKLPEGTKCCWMGIVESWDFWLVGSFNRRFCGLESTCKSPQGFFKLAVQNLRDTRIWPGVDSETNWQSVDAVVYEFECDLLCSLFHLWHSQLISCLIPAGFHWKNIRWGDHAQRRSKKLWTKKCCQLFVSFCGFVTLW